MKGRRGVAAVLLVGAVLIVAPAGARAQRSPSDDEAVQKLYVGFFDSLRQVGRPAP